MKFNGSRKDALKIIADDFGGDHEAFNAKYESITIDGRSVKGFRKQGPGRPLKINYTDTVNKYEGARKEYIELSTPDPEVRKAGAQVFNMGPEWQAWVKSGGSQSSLLRQEFFKDPQKTLKQLAGAKDVATSKSQKFLKTFRPW